MTSEQIAYRILDLAIEHRAKAKMLSSADICIADAKRSLETFHFNTAARWALRSLSYSLGISSPLF